MKYLVFFTAILLTAACATLAGEGRSPVEGPLPPPGTEIGRVAHGRAYYCGDVGFVDLGAAFDAPAYYFRRRDGVILCSSGGIRRPGPDQPPRCPPAIWTCKQPPPNLGGGR